MSENFSYPTFDLNFLIANPKFLSELAAFYCEIWRHDEKFGEFKKCPQCDHYYSENFVVTLGNTTCPTCKVDLVEAWVPDKVEQTILQRAALGNQFFGAVAYDNVDEKIMGFVWGYNQPLSEVETADMLASVQNPTGFVPYWNEFAIDFDYRKKGHGDKLGRKLTQWFKDNFSGTPGYLHTHMGSVAFHVFEKAGYVFHSHDLKLGDGRIYMYISDCANLTPENL